MIVRNLFLFNLQETSKVTLGTLRFVCDATCAVLANATAASHVCVHTAMDAYHVYVPQERERVHWEEQRKSMQADQYNKAELARYAEGIPAEHLHGCSERSMCSRLGTS